MKNLVQTPPEQEAGWRAGRPLEDPAKTKRWGFVTAKPSEFLVHCRRGRVLRSSGQGATCFKWPWDSVAVVPTSFQRVQFVADQVTRERAGVGITGLAVYRIAQPLLAFRVLNFSYPERAQQKLEDTLTEMLMGATRRLVANLTVDECLEKRKAALADELLREIAPVVGGSGRPDDSTDGGWGVVLDTVEIQEVSILSERVFASMQAPFRAALEQRAREARADAERQGARAEAAARRDVEQATLEADAAVQARRDEVEREEAERAAAGQLRRLELELREQEARLTDERRRMAISLELEQARVEDARTRQALAAAEAQARIDSHELLMRAGDLAAARERAAWLSEAERRRTVAEVDQVVGRAEAEVALARAQAEAASCAARARLVAAERLPELAAAVGARFGEVNVTHIGGGDGAFSSIAQAVAGVIELARNA